MTKGIPEGHHSITPYLIVQNAKDAIEYYQKAFNATVLYQMDKNGRVGHAELKIGNSIIMLADEFAEMQAYAPKHFGGSPISICLYTENVDKVYQQAIQHGGTVINAVADQFYGDRLGILQDPFGHTWYVATHIEDVTPEEIAKRMANQ